MKAPRPLVEGLILAILLPAVAGAVNAVGFFAVGTYTSHMSGTVARIGDELAQGHLGSAAFFLGMVGAFFAGAAVATTQILLAHSRERARYVLTMITQALTLSIYTGLTVATKRPGALASDFLPVALLCFSMGLQNAMVTKISGAIIRTTHLTGIVTDLAIESVRLVHGMASSRTQLKELGQHPEFKKLRLHFSIFASFLAGAVVGPLVYLSFGPLSMLIPVGLLMLLAVVDTRMGLVQQHGHVSWEISDPHVPVVRR